MKINVQCYGVGIDGAGSIRLVLHQVTQTTPPAGCFSMSDGILRLAPEDVKRFHTFVVRLWAHPAGRDMVEFEVKAATLEMNGDAPLRIGGA